MSGESSALKRFILNSSLILLGVLVLILFYALAANHFSQSNESETARIAPVEASTGIREIYDVEILNGCGEHGLAAKMREYLIAHHFDVVGTGNHTNFELEETQIIDRKGNDVAARRIASILGVDPREIVRDLNQNRQVDVSVIIGKDYKSIDPFTE